MQLPCQLPPLDTYNTQSCTLTLFANPATSDELRVMTHALNGFAQDIHRSLAKRFPNESFAFSAVSVAPVLGMVLRGMHDHSDRTLLLEKMGLAGWPAERVHVTLGQVCRNLVSGESKPKIRVANAVTGNVDEMKEGYRHAVREHYNAEVFPSGPDVVAAINQWAAEKTDGFLDHVVDSVPKNLLVCLMNAIYFEADWKNAFEESATKPMPFHSIDGSTDNVQMMYMKDERARVARFDDMAYMEKSYGTDNGQRWTFAVLMPQGETTMEQLESRLSMDTVINYRAGFRHHGDTNLYIPRMKLEHSMPNFEKVLEEMGIPNGTLLRELHDEAYIGEIVHKVKMDVDEKGTKAAAFTGAMCRALCLPPPEVEFKADRPFIAMILAEDQILFQVAVKDTRFLEKV